MFGRNMFFFSPSNCSCGCNTLCARTPTVVTGVAEDITNTSAIIVDNRLFDFRRVDRAGVMFSTTQNFAMSGKAFGPAASPFSVNLTGLEPNTTYYYRAFACADCALTLGDIRSFTTSGQPGGQVTTGIATDITATSALIEDNSFSGMICDTMSQGVQYSLNPSMTSSVMVNSATGTPFSVTLNGLTASTTYYYRAFVICDGVTTYGSIRNFTTSGQPGGQVTTGIATDITATSALIADSSFSGMICATMSQGVQYSLNPSMTSPVMVNGASGTPFSVTLNGLTASTTYYYRAFVICDGVTTYGSIRNFTTAAATGGTLTTGFATNVTNSTATIAGNTFSGFTTPITAVGLQYSTNANMSNARTAVTAAVSPFSLNLTGLSPNTVYYFRAFLTTNGMTRVGQIRSVTTGSNPPGIIVTTGEAANVNRNNVTIIGNRYQFVSTPVTRQGVQISTQSNMSGFTQVTTAIGTPYNALIAGLNPGTLYYFRAFIVTNGMTFVGSTKSFRTQF